MDHICVYFEDGWPELVCACGERAVLMTGDDGQDVLTPLAHPERVGQTSLPLSA